MFDFSKLAAMQEQMQASKQKLDGIMVRGEAGNGAVKIEATANRRITNISINPSIVDPQDVEQLEDLLLTALNRVTEAAEQKAAEETSKMASSMLPPGFNIPGLF